MILNLLLGEYIISIEIFQRVLLEFISFISKFFYVFTMRSMLPATCLRILKFLLHLEILSKKQVILSLSYVTTYSVAWYA